MKFDAIQLHAAAITLENEQQFYKRYNEAAPKHNAHNRRDLICDFLVKCAIRGHDADDREHLRRYFDDTYGIPATTAYAIQDLPTLEFWRDEVKYPPALPPQLREGSKFDVSFGRPAENNTRDKWARYGRIWNANEAAQLKGLFWSGRNLEYICRAMERPPSGVLNKLAEFGCLHYDPIKTSYFVAKKTPTNSNTSDVGLTPEPEPTTSPAEIAEHIDKAVSHLTRVSNSLKEILMNKTEIIKIETKTFVNGVDIATMDDADVYALIATQEAQIKELDKIETKPKKLTAEIEKRKAGVQALVDYLDSKPE